MKKYSCIESTIEIALPQLYLFGILLRLWINKKEISDNESLIRQKYVESITKYFESGNPSTTEIIEYIVNLIPDINAIQICDLNYGKYNDKYGTVVYTVPFSEDVHG